MFNKMGTLNGCFQEINENKYLEKYEEQWIKIRDLIRSVTKEWYDYDKKYIKIKLDSDYKLPLKRYKFL